MVEESPTISTMKEMFGNQANVISQFKPNNNASYGKMPFDSSLIAAMPFDSGLDECYQ